MGNIISSTYDFTDNLYEKYYPRSNFLRPVYLSSAFMVAGLTGQLLVKERSPPTTFNNFVFLFSSGASLGIHIWVSLVSGLTMMKLLPRHQFGLVQSYLFPKYFFLTTAFSFSSLISFLKMNPISSLKNDTLALGTLLASSFALNLLNFVYLNVKTIFYNQRMHKLEREVGEGITIIGKLKQQNKVESNPEYLLARKKFGIFHGVSLTANLLSFISIFSQFYLLASKSYFSF